MTPEEKQINRYENALTNTFLKKLEENLEWQYRIQETLEAKNFAEFKKNLLTLTDFRDLVVSLYGNDVIKILDKNSQLKQFYDKHKLLDNKTV